MRHAATVDTPLRVGIFSTVEAADQAVAGLLAAGFTKDEITVVCSERVHQEHFKAFEHQDPAGLWLPKPWQPVLRFGAIGAGWWPSHRS